MGGDLSLWEAILIAIVEGLTEFLPVSSTGHMIIAQSVLGIESTEFVKAFTVIIQFGAILSVLCLYWRRFFVMGTASSDMESPVRAWLQRLDFYVKLLLAFLPAAFFGLLFADAIDSLLERVEVVAAMLVLGGLFMLFTDRLFPPRKDSRPLTEKRAVAIGFFQCIAMIPGVSRSMATIVGGMAQGLTRKDAAEFSFFLAVPTMFAATCFKLLKLLLAPEGMDILRQNWEALLLGNLVAFVVALLAIKFFIGFVTRYGFTGFGWYRIAVGGVLLLLSVLGYQLHI